MGLQVRVPERLAVDRAFHLCSLAFLFKLGQRAASLNFRATAVGVRAVAFLLGRTELVENGRRELLISRILHYRLN